MSTNPPSVSSNLDDVQAKLNQASAILTMLFNDGGQGHFDNDHETILSVIWTSLDLVNTAQTASQQAYSAYMAEIMTMIPPAATPQN